MGKITYDPEDGFGFISDNGVEYELLEGESLGGNTTSDIIFIMVKDQFDENGNNVFEVGHLFVEWLFGAELLTREGTKYHHQIISSLDGFTERHEKEHPYIVDYFKRKNKTGMIEDIINTIDKYYDTNKEVLSTVSLMKLDEQRAYMNKLKKAVEKGECVWIS